MPDAVGAWVFPGQGAQEPGMGRDLYEKYGSARDLFDRADAVLGRKLSALCFDGPADEQNKTANAQPAIYVMSLACLAAAGSPDQLLSTTPEAFRDLILRSGVLRKRLPAS